jgi:hypothetical protein
VRAATALLALALLAPAAAYAQAPAKPDAAKADEASARFKAGVSFYKDGDFPAALVEFKRAYDLLPNYNVLYNLGQTARELKDYAAALSSFERYLAEGGKKIDAKRAKEVQAAVEELRRKVGKLRITTNVEGAEITVDDASVGAAPLKEALTVNAGRRKVGATASGYTPLSRIVEVASQAETPVALELVKVEVAAPAPVVEPPKEQGFKIPLTAWIAGGGTAACLVLTGVLGGVAVSARGSLKDALGHFPGDAKTIADAQARTRTFAVATDVFMGLTLAGAAATTTLLVLGNRAEKGDKAAPTTSFAVTPGGAVIRGSF